MATAARLAAVVKGLGRVNKCDANFAKEVANQHLPETVAGLIGRVHSMAQSLDGSSPRPPLAPVILGIKVAVAMFVAAMVVLLCRPVRDVLFGVANWDASLAKLQARLPSVVILWVGTGAVVGTTLGFLVRRPMTPRRTILIGILVGALAVAVGMAVCSPLFPFDPAARQRFGPLATAALAAGLGAVAGAIMGGIAGAVFDSVRQSLTRATLRAAICGLIYALVFT